MYCAADELELRRVRDYGTEFWHGTGIVESGREILIWNITRTRRIYLLGYDTYRPTLCHSLVWNVFGKYLINMLLQLASRQTPKFMLCSRSLQSRGRIFAYNLQLETLGIHKIAITNFTSGVLFIHTLLMYNFHSLKSILPVIYTINPILHNKKSTWR